MLTETQARAIVNLFLYPEEFRVNERVMGALVKKGFAESTILQSGKCTPKGERVAMRQLVYLLSVRGLVIKEKRVKGSSGPLKE